jgi:hypothetical protein
MRYGCEHARHILHQRYWNTRIEGLKEIVLPSGKGSAFLGLGMGSSPAGIMNFDSPKEAKEDWYHDPMSSQNNRKQVEEQLVRLKNVVHIQNRLMHLGWLNPEGAKRYPHLVQCLNRRME